MKAKTLKILTFIVTLLVVMSMGASIVFGTTPIDVQPVDVGDLGDSVKTIGGKFVSIFQIVGSVLAVIILMILGIKYMMGSAEEKAEYKKTMIPYLVGAILLFAASTLANVVYQLAQGLTTK